MEKWANYKFKKQMKNEIKKQKSFVEIAETIGINRSYLSQIINGRGCTKIIAYAMCKAISPDIEIDNLFEKVK